MAPHRTSQKPRQKQDDSSGGQSARADPPKSSGSQHTQQHHVPPKAHTGMRSTPVRQVHKNASHSLGAAQVAGDGHGTRGNAPAGTQTMIQGAALCDRVAARLNDVLSRLDGDESQEEGVDVLSRDLPSARGQHGHDSSGNGLAAPDGTSLINFKKTWCYANSRLPPYMPPLRIYTETWPIICRAAEAADKVYSRQRTAVQSEREDFIPANWRTGTKAMTVTTSTTDEKGLIILAVRGSKWNLADWAINFRPSPTLPTNFLDDDGNACHAGFLSVARAMVPVIAARLRSLLGNPPGQPGRASSSLVFTGHSAGGAVASLLYMHMLATCPESSSELNSLRQSFRRIHCVTFGAPPVSLLPLLKPVGPAYFSSVFLSFANEGDPVVRADRQYIRTLARVVASPTPDVYPSSQGEDSKGPQAAPRPPFCEVPEATLSNAGRLALLRARPGLQKGVEIVGVDDAALRGLVFGDPGMHAMALYRTRIEILAFAAVTGKDASGIY